MARCNTQANDKAMTANKWKTHGASDPGRYTWLPTADANLVEWWTSINPQPKLRKETWIVIPLVVWILWKHMNDVVFNETAPSTSEILKKIDLQGQDWRSAGQLHEARSLPVRVDEWASSE